MIYVCSDIHGRYDRWMKLLETINFGPEDTMYVLGDVIDRGPDGIKILLDIAARKNVHLLMGNHEYMMLVSLADVFSGKEYSRTLNVWTKPKNGGAITLAAFLDASEEEQNTVIELLQDALVIKIIEINGQKFHLSHSNTIDVIEKDEYKVSELSIFDLNDVLWTSPFRGDELYVPLDYYNGSYCYIVGHVPTQRINGVDTTEFVKTDTKNGCIIDIDLGCALDDTARNCLGCLRLDDMEEFKIE